MASVETPTKQPVMAVHSGPIKKHFIVGGAGAIIASVMAVFIVFLGVTNIYVSGISFALVDFDLFHTMDSFFFGNITSLIFTVGLILMGIGYRGFRSNYGLGIGTAGFALSVVVSVFWFINTTIGVLWWIAYYSDYGLYLSMYSFADADGILWLIGLSLFGAALVIYGAAHINARKFTGNSGLGIATGTMLIIAGSLMFTLFLFPFGMLLFLVGGILAAIVFLTAKTPQSAANHRHL